MPKITQRDIVESVTGLRDTAKVIRSMIEAGSRDRNGNVTVTIRPDGLMRQATYLDQVADELATLIPDEPVVVPAD
jgi:hypothetical protein